MNNFISLILAFLFFVPNTYAQSKADLSPKIEQPESSIFYVLNLGLFNDAVLDDFKNISKLGYVYANDLGNRQWQIYLGDFEDNSQAENALQIVKEKGFVAAFLSAYKNDTEKEYYIQLSSLKMGEKINWKKYAVPGKLAVISSGIDLKIVLAGFENDSLARLSIPLVKAKGFPDAFVKAIAINRIHPIGSFEKGNSETVSSGKIAKSTAKSKTNSKPKQMGSAGSFSTAELKAALAAMNFYKGSIDNSPDPLLAAQYQYAKENNRTLAKFAILAQAMKPKVERYSELQLAINSVRNNPLQAEQILKKSSLPVAKAYRAYILFTREGVDIKEVNKLMNQAIREAFSGNQPRPKEFDANATYSYQDIGQLIAHISYIQVANKGETMVPTWIFAEHPKEAKVAFSKSKGFLIVPDDQFLNNSEDLKMLLLMAQDLNPSHQSDPKLETTQAQNRTRMYYLSSDSDLSAKRELLSWNKSLWVGLDQWSRKEEGNSVLYQAFKATYYQCLSGLEKYFTESKYNAGDSTILGLNIINQTIGKSVEKFIYLQPNSK